MEPGVVASSLIAASDFDVSLFHTSLEKDDHVCLGNYIPDPLKYDKESVTECFDRTGEIVSSLSLAFY